MWPVWSYWQWSTYVGIHPNGHATKRTNAAPIRPAAIVLHGICFSIRLSPFRRSNIFQPNNVRFDRDERSEKERRRDPPADLIRYAGLRFFQAVFFEPFGEESGLRWVAVRGDLLLVSQVWSSFPVLVEKGSLPGRLATSSPLLVIYRSFQSARFRSSCFLW